MVNGANARRQLSSCQGKERFNTFERARQIGRRVARRREEKISPYRCPHCNGFHLGTHVGPVKGETTKHGELRKDYAVFAVKGGGPDTLVGFSSASDGGRVAEYITREGWKVTRIIARKRGPK